MGAARADDVEGTDFELFLKVSSTCWSHAERPRSWRALHQAFRLGAPPPAERAALMRMSEAICLRTAASALQA